jgi:phage baseplate assembly protein W
MNIDFPFQFDHRGSTALAAQDDHIRDLIEQLLFTNPGERVNRPEFGSGLLNQVFAPNSSELAGQIEFSVRAALQRWLGDVIEVQKLTATADDATLSIAISYQLRRSGEPRTDTFERRIPS